MFSLQSIFSKTIKLAALTSVFLYSSQGFGMSLPDVCATQGANRTQELRDGVPICLNDTNTAYHNIRGASNHSSIAITTSHGTGDLSLYVDDGRWPVLDNRAFESENAGTNTECVIIRNPRFNFLYLGVTGTRSRASIVIDLGATSCRTGGSTPNPDPDPDPNPNPDPDPTPVNPGSLPDMCATTTGDPDLRTLVSGQPVCMPGGARRSGYAFSGANNHSSVAISTAHGEGNLSLIAKNGGWPVEDGSEPGVSIESKHVGNTECVILRSNSGNLPQFWSNIYVTGARDKASIVVDLGATTCRVTPGAVDPGNQGYTLRKSHVIIYPFDFNGEPLSQHWTEAQMNADMRRVNEYFQEQSYGAFSVTWEIKGRTNAGNKNSYRNQTEWKEFVYETVRNNGQNPSFPGTGNVYMFTAPPLLNLNSTAGPPEMNIFHYIPGTIAHELGHALGLRHSMSVEAGNQVMDAARDSISNYGNVFSMMGMGAQAEEEVNLMYKSYFDGWLNLDADLPVVNQSGTYRIYAHDHGSASGHGAPGDIGLRLKSADGSLTYWLEFRTDHTRNDYDDIIRNGVLVNVQGYKETEGDSSFWKHRSALLDFTPNSQSTANWALQDETDAPIAVGKTWTDPSGKFRIKPLATGGSVGVDASGYIDVEVTILR